MAQSPAHRLGQIIGDELEAAIREPLAVIAGEFGLYLDHKHPRPARGGKRKVAWTDSWGNTHDLDYVLEDHGSEIVIGSPRAFIETAWRRYTKHSRNKAQEIQGALSPLAETYQSHHPFLGAVLAGDFTDGALDQLQSHRFNLAYCPYESVIRVFANAGVDVSSDEDTSQHELQRKVEAFDALALQQRQWIRKQILSDHLYQFNPFFAALRQCFNRRVERIFVVPLSGVPHEFSCVADAVRFVTEYDESAPVSTFKRYELNIRYSNGDEVRGEFQGQDRAIEFLWSFEM